MFSAFANPFHKPEKSLSEKGLSGTLYYANKSSRDVAQLADDNRVAANNLMSYGSMLGDDLTDVTSKLGNMMLQWSNIMIEFSDAIDQYRETLKSVALKEAALQPARDQKRKIKEKIEQLGGSLQSLDKIEILNEQLKQLEEETEPAEVEMKNFKRMATREALYIFLNGMHAMASKTDIISTFGKYIADELNVNPVKPGEERPLYQGAEKTKRITEDAQKALSDWNPDKTKIRRTLTSHHGHNPLIIKQLPSLPKSSSTKTNDSNSSAVTPSPSTSTNSVKSDVVIPPRNASLEEQHKQYSFYKPDDVVAPATESEEEAAQSSPPPPPPTGGFSGMYLNNHYQQPSLNHQNLYQFYQHYLPPKSYEEMTKTFSPGAVFRSDETKKHDAGGFVLPSTNPNFALSPSRSVKSDDGTSE